MSLHVRHPPGVLGAIVARTVRELDVCAVLDERPDHLVLRDFAGALEAPGLSLIAEVKPRSPSAGDLRRVDPDAVAAAYAPHAAAVSVLVDGPSFGGSFELLRAIRERVPCPVLAKGFFVHGSQVCQAHAAGADAVLLMASILPPDRLAELLELVRDLGMEALVEAHDDAELDEVLATDARVVGVNSRDLATLAIDLPAAIARLARVEGRIRVAESGLVDAASVEAVRPVADAVLVGTALMRSEDPSAAIRALGLGRSTCS
ncbi:MAG: indole-3-glycerol-phosphate synthase [Alphaproteobacteria bacterium]|nr:indole-3-glycerol-phosphate synthase [Alphaproteobacteria bacterium]